ncbi:MAG: hypothetical protein PF637_01870 [Spirochaetes bacterium]|jgi:hypothetical protein|nr:hypothetical protein [Spirochaetota bacterium]
MNMLLKEFPTSHSLTVLIHGLESSKDDWTEKNGFTKGGNLTALLEDNELSYCAQDLYGHGQFKADEPGFDPTDISDELWPLFIKRSVRACLEAIESLCNSGAYQSLNVITYSGGSQIGVELLKEQLSLPVAVVAMAVPPLQRDYDDEYSLHNNLDVFSNTKNFFFFGIADEETPIEDCRWLVPQLPKNSVHFEYQSGHSLPVQWVSDCLSELLRVV